MFIRPEWAYGSVWGQAIDDQNTSWQTDASAMRRVFLDPRTAAVYCLWPLW